MTGLLVEDVSDASHSSDDDELAPAEEVLAELGDYFFVSEAYLDYLSKPKDMEIIVYSCRDDFGNPMWMAVAPEWQCALGFGSSFKAASDDLKSILVNTKQSSIKAKNILDIKGIPWNPRPEKAMAIRIGRRDGYYDGEEKAYFDELEKESSNLMWCTIQV